MCWLPKGSTSERTPYGIVVIERDGQTHIKAVFVNGVHCEAISVRSNRRVFKVPRRGIVVKVDRYENQCEVEGRLYGEHLEKEDRKHFAATLYWGRGFNIQKFVTFTRAPENGTTPQGKIVDRLQEKYGLSDIYGSGSCRQWGITSQGKLVIHDYGFSAKVRCVYEGEG